MVVAIIGILAGLAVPAYQTYIYRAKAVEIIQFIDRLRSGMLEVQAETHLMFPTEISLVTSQDKELAFDYATMVGNTYNHIGTVPGLTKSELAAFQSKTGLNFSATTVNFRCRTPGQYAVYLLFGRDQLTPAQKAGAKQLALAAKHVMLPQTYHTAIDNYAVTLYLTL